MMHSGQAVGGPFDGEAFESKCRFYELPRMNAAYKLFENGMEVCNGVPTGRDGAGNHAFQIHTYEWDGECWRWKGAR